MERLEMLDKENWEEALGSGWVYLMLGKSDCPACNEWTLELRQLLVEEKLYPQVRFAKMLLDQPGLGAFKKAAPWLKDVEVLPYSLIYRDGVVVKQWVGGGKDRLTNRLDRLLAEA